jgi:hypothetical protein
MLLWFLRLWLWQYTLKIIHQCRGDNPLYSVALPNITACNISEYRIERFIPMTLTDFFYFLHSLCCSILYVNIKKNTCSQIIKIFEATLKTSRNITVNSCLNWNKNAERELRHPTLLFDILCWFLKNLFLKNKILAEGSPKTMALTFRLD